MHDEIKIKTLTPLWTGDIDGKCSKIKETGIIGSLRWWYEALVRGLGGSACDPTDSTCQFDYKKYHATGNVEDGLHDVCDACRLFGCTDWRRRFRIETEYDNESINHNLFFKTTMYERSDNLKWWLNKIFEINKKVVFGDITLKFSGETEYLDTIKGLLYFMYRYAGIGAKNQYGFGQFKFSKDKKMNECQDKWKKIAQKGLKYSIFHNFFFLKFTLNESSYLIDIFKKAESIKGTPDNFNWIYIPIAMDFRYKGKINNNYFGIKNHFKERGLDDEIFGFVSRDKKMKKASSINVSSLYKVELDERKYHLKIWGILPSSTLEIKNFLKNIKKAIPKELSLEKEIVGNDIWGDLN